MPEYRLMEDIIYPYMRETKNEKKTSTQKTEACVAKPLEMFFGRMFISEITGAVVRQYRRARIDVDGVVPATVLRELALASKIEGGAMNTIWILVLLSIGSAPESVPIAFPTQEACDREGARAVAKLGTTGHPMRFVCLKRDSDR